MANYTITESVHIDIRVDGATISGDYEPGVVELHPAVAEVLVAQGIASLAIAEPEAEPAPAKASKKTTPKDTPTETTEA